MRNDSFNGPLTTSVAVGSQQETDREFFYQDHQLPIIEYSQDKNYQLHRKIQFFSGRRGSQGDEKSVLIVRRSLEGLELRRVSRRPVRVDGVTFTRLAQSPRRECSDSPTRIGYSQKIVLPDFLYEAECCSRLALSSIHPLAMG